jgi:TPP-dependent pyruvate/acetoin dehydrogenase alpha subunit
MDVLDTYSVLCEAVRRVREERRPLLVEAVTYRFRGHSMADPEQYRSKEEVAQWRARDPLPAFAGVLIAEGVIDEAERERIDAEALALVDAAVEFAEASPFPAPESLYDDVYVLDPNVRGWYSQPHEEPPPGAAAGATDAAEPAANDEIPQQLTHALAAGEDGHGEADPQLPPT